MRGTAIDAAAQLDPSSAPMGPDNRVPVHRGSPHAADRADAHAAPTRRFVVISGYHDFRSKRKANLHFIAEELSRYGAVFFLSIRYSRLSRMKDDPRHDLWDRANRVEVSGGISCYLWRTIIHPPRLPSLLAPLERLVFAAFSRVLPSPARDAIAAAERVFIESGMALIYLPLIKRLNPNAEIIYLASDSLDAIGQAETIKAAFHRHAGLVSWARLPSPYLRDDVPASIPCRVIPHGIEKARFDAIGPSPFSPGSRNAVAVGSMLFDASFFALAAPRFPDITFHVIGSGHRGLDAENVIFHPEMPFAQTLPYLKHCTFAIAPYGDGIEPYLTHTSMKLTQYNYLGLPAVCPDTVAGEGLGRFGYRRGDAASIAAAIDAALAAGAAVPLPRLSWSDVADRLMTDASTFDGLETDLNSALH